MYAGYIASAFLLPEGHQRQPRRSPPGTEEFHGPMGDTARFFLVGLRPGTSYEVGSTFRAGGQIDPILPVNVHFVLTYPGRTPAGGRRRRRRLRRVRRTDRRGRWTSRASTATSSAPRGTATRAACRACRTRAASSTSTRRPGPSSAAGLTIDGSPHRTFAATGDDDDHWVEFRHGSVHYTMVTPGAVIGQGELPVSPGKFTLVFDPVAVHAKVPLYDIVNNTTGTAQIGRVVHITFFSEENSAGQTFHDVTRVLLRGTTVLSARAPAARRTEARAHDQREPAGHDHRAHGQHGRVDCDSCSMPLPAGTTVTLTATAAPGSIFVGWTGACSGMGPCTVTVDAATTVGATFQSATIHRQYFAEGAATTFFDCEFALANPGDTTRARDDAVPQGRRRDGRAHARRAAGLAPHGRREARARPRAGAGLLDRVESDALVVADRTMSWDRTDYGSHVGGRDRGARPDAGTSRRARRSDGFQLYYLLENPNDRATDVQVTYLRPEPAGADRPHALPACRSSRRTMLVNGEAPGLAVGGRVRASCRRSTRRRPSSSSARCTWTRRGSSTPPAPTARRHVAGNRLVLRRGRHGRARSTCTSCWRTLARLRRTSDADLLAGRAGAR